MVPPERRTGLIMDPESARAVVGEIVNVRLEGAPTTGYSWELQERDPIDVLQPLGDEVELPTSHGRGGAATQIFRFRALRAGESRLHFVFKRPWESKPIRQLEVAVLVGQSDYHVAGDQR